jgi:hypothetical protein
MAAERTGLGSEESQDVEVLAIPCPMRPSGGRARLPPGAAGRPTEAASAVLQGSNLANRGSTETT